MKTNIREKISLVGQTRGNSCRGMRDNAEFVGVYVKEDHESKVRHLKQEIANYISQPEPCDYNSNTGHVDCNWGCAGDIEGIRCSETDLWANRRELSKMESRFPPSLAFREPSLAKKNGLLEKDMFYNHL